jgi:hypothetical protein
MVSRERTFEGLFLGSKVTLSLLWSFDAFSKKLLLKPC